MSELKSYFPENFRRLRKQKGLTLDEMAIKMGRGTSSGISAYETGKNYPTGTQLIKIVELFNVNLHDLFFKKGYGDEELEQMGLVAEGAEKFTTLHEKVDELESRIGELESQLRAFSKSA